MINSRAIGSTFIIAGTTVGAGMLALPMVSAHQGFPYALLTLLGVWVMALYGALLLLEVNLLFPRNASFSTLGKQVLGRFGQYFINLCMVLLFYCLSTAYIAGGSHFLNASLTQYVNSSTPAWSSAVLFTLVLGGLVTWHTYAVDLANRLLLTLKMIAFFAVIFLLLPHVDYSQLTTATASGHVALLSIPIFFTAFGFHGSIPSIVKYVGHYPATLRLIIITGSAIPLLLYLLWEIVTLGILPLYGATSFDMLTQQHATVANFITALATMVNRPLIHAGINFFTDVAMTTSFLGVTLGLFDFFADMLNAKQQFSRRIATAAITFLPPLVFVLLYPGGFIAALSYAAVPLAFLAIILPALMAWRTRQQKQGNHYRYRATKNNALILLMLLAGTAMISLVFI